jgi:hypothetical protein
MGECVISIPVSAAALSVLCSLQQRLSICCAAVLGLSGSSTSVWFLPTPCLL